MEHQLYDNNGDPINIYSDTSSNADKLQSITLSPLPYTYDDWEPELSKDKESISLISNNTKDSDETSKKCCSYCSKVKCEMFVLILLFLSYCGSYTCRDHMFVVSEQFKQSENVTQEGFATMMTAGYAIYPIGKLMFGPLADRVGGKIILITSYLGSGFFSFIFSVMHNFTFFIFFWLLIRISQSGAWIGLVKIAGAWVPPNRRGKAMSFLSLSFLAGDALARRIQSIMINEGSDWRHIFYMSSFVTSSMACLTLFISESPESIGFKNINTFPEKVLPLPSPLKKISTTSNVDEKESSTSTDVTQNVYALLKDTSFQLILFQSFCLTLIREGFNAYLVEYLESLPDVSESEAAATSSILPLAGIPSTLLYGYIIDRLPSTWRGILAPISSGILFLTLFILVWSSLVTLSFITLLLVISGFSLMGIYATVTGIYMLDMGIRYECTASCSALTDAFGIMGAVVIMAISALDLKYTTLFSIMTLVAGITTVAGIIFCVIFGKQESKPKKTRLKSFA